MKNSTKMMVQIISRYDKYFFEIMEKKTFSFSDFGTASPENAWLDQNTDSAIGKFVENCVYDQFFSDLALIVNGKNDLVTFEGGRVHLDYMGSSP